MNIKELETLTGITRQNIRFYEKKGLLKPERNPQNDYREYTQEDVKRLQTVKMFRMLDISIEDIRMLLDGETSMEVTIENHLHQLTEQESQLKAAIEICRQLLNKKLEAVDVDEVLDRMEELEKNGGGFMKFVDDYKKVVREEEQKTFSFVPENMALTPAQFTEELFRYADENHLDLVITKEGMYPVFEIDGVEYEADRVFGMFGAIIRCRMTHPEEAEVSEVPENNRRKAKALHQMTGLLVFAVLVMFIVVSRGFSFTALLVAAFMAIGFCYVYSWYYKNLR